MIPLFLQTVPGLPIESCCAGHPHDSPAYAIHVQAAATTADAPLEHGLAPNATDTLEKVPCVAPAFFEQATSSFDAAPVQPQVTVPARNVFSFSGDTRFLG
jgi:hypothetical protein